jgi:glycosyltransferase involved in cell wall biosynthesis
MAALKGTRARVAHIQYQTGAYGMRPTANLLPLLLHLVSRAKVVVTFHDLRVPYLFPKAGALREWANRLMAGSAHAVIATNPEDAATLRSWGVKQVDLIPIGSNITNSPPPGYSREEWREARGIARGTTLLAYFGFLNSSKGLDDLLRALRTLRATGRDYRLLMVGGGLGSSDPTNRATAQSLDALAADLGVHESLIWTGFLSPEEVSAALLAADMAVLPYADGASFRRGSLLAVLDHGLPLVTTTPAPADAPEDWPVFKHGENALLAPPGDADALAELVAELEASPELRARLKKGALRSRTFFSWKSIAFQHLSVYARLTNREGAP